MPFAHGDHVGRDAVALDAEPGAEPAEAADHLVGDEEHVALAQDPLDLGPVAVGRRDHAAGADHRLADERGARGRRARRARRRARPGRRRRRRARPRRASRSPPGWRRCRRARCRTRSRRGRRTGATRSPAARAGRAGSSSGARSCRRCRRRRSRRCRRRPRASSSGASAATRSASRSAGSLAKSPKVWCAASVRICAAAASASSARPWPTLANQSPAVASRYSRPSASQTRAPSPRAMTNSAPSTAPIAANGCQRRVPLIGRNRIRRGRLGSATWIAIQVEAARRRLEAAGGGYEIVHTSPGLEVGVYVLVAPEPDHQSAHADDELYVVLEGDGELTVEGETRHAARGPGRVRPGRRRPPLHRLRGPERARRVLARPGRRRSDAE